MTSAKLIDSALARLPRAYDGPGGVAAILRDGKVIERHAWGYADLDRRVAMSPSTLMPICSVTKQFTCALLFDLFGDPSTLDGDVAAWLPHLEQQRPSIADLANNQSGLRDYWALTVLHGASAEGLFTRENARELLQRTRTLHFAPGTRYSYCNANFHILGEIVRERSGRDLGEVMRERLFEPAGMAHALLAPDTAARPGNAVGYEGNATLGFFPAVSNIWWAGDAGICASLDDLIAWEAFIDATREDYDGLYRTLARPRSFADGRPSQYSFGLAHGVRHGRATTGHGGALRGWRCHRVNVDADRLSVVVMFNHEANARDAALSLLDAALGYAPQGSFPAPTEERGTWAGEYIDAETGLVTSIAQTGNGLALRFGTGAELLAETGPDYASNASTILQRRDGRPVMTRPGENLSVVLDPVEEGAPDDDIAGTYHAPELDAHLDITSAGGALYGAFSGFLGEGPVQPLQPVGRDLWFLPVRRSMDAPAPGNWTVRVRRDAAGTVAGLDVGCWLARANRYDRMS